MILFSFANWIFFMFSQFAAFIRITWVETVNLRNKAKKIYWLGKNVRWDFKMCWERLQPRLIIIIAWQKSNVTNFICQVRHLESRNWKVCFTYDMKQFSDLIKYESEYNVAPIREFVQSFCPVSAINIDHFDPSPTLAHVVF